ncbi:unnamed protein product [Closterium sp. Yama58-4]|nr:unnamed protein product [Closterium sp. Yama58-4]
MPLSLVNSTLAQPVCALNQRQPCEQQLAASSRFTLAGPVARRSLAVRASPSAPGHAAPSEHAPTGPGPEAVAREEQAVKEARVRAEVSRRIRQLGREGNASAAVELFTQMQADGIAPDAMAATALIDCCVRCVAVGVLLRAYGRKSPPQWAKIQQLLTRMELDFGLQPSTAIFNELMDICARDNAVDRGVQLLDRMAEAGVEPDAFTFEAVKRRRTLRISAAANAPPSPGASAQEANTAPAPASAAPVTVKLGFLLPVQERNLDIPLNLAREWGSAAQVALDVLATRYTGFAIKPVFQAVECTAENAAVGADALVKQGVAGVVGPACSEAAVGAAPVLGRAGIPMVSFAATADALRNRTAFGDRHQAAAIRSVVDQLQWKRLLVFHTAETYGEALAYDVAQEPQLQVRTVRIPHPPPADCSAYFPPAADDWMKGSEDMGVVLAVLPSTASCLWAAASKLNLLGYPWWYLGTDGVAALDLMDAAPQSGEEMLANRMLNELALVPSGADPSGEQPFAPFKAYWQQQSYAAFPGLLTFDASPRFSAPRAFVPHLVDAVWAFHEAVNKTVGEHGASLSASHLLACFNDSPADCVSFPGATGHVHFDSDSGERTKVQASPRYSLMQFAGLPWMNSPASTTPLLTACPSRGPRVTCTLTPTRASAARCRRRRATRSCSLQGSPGWYASHDAGTAGAAAAAAAALLILLLALLLLMLFMRGAC